ncbi:keratin, type II cytoskeletal 8-like isoform X3 [Syngnathus typhle]|uniref:keratin, type II cytoskeletal 8-like isoform X3 n=1 Tax=Syngnathus typhle TaxID=161592 RepID=UPI002A6B42E6|nr:keratin, type II cytoskeletal 8-like isoform X3 [Syngnathus typhle]
MSLTTQLDPFIYSRCTDPIRPLGMDGWTDGRMDGCYWLMANIQPPRNSVFFFLLRFLDLNPVLPPLDWMQAEAGGGNNRPKPALNGGEPVRWSHPAPIFFPCACHCVLSLLAMSEGRADSSQSSTPDGGSATPARSDPSDNVHSAGKFREKDDMVALNDKFVRLIEKVKQQEDENQKLDAKLKILREQEPYVANISSIAMQLEEALKQQIDHLLGDQTKLEDELFHNQQMAENSKKRYEEELLRKAELENEFIITKKDADEGHLEAVHFTLALEDLIGQLDFLRMGYDEEIKELQSQIQNETVVIRGKAKRSLDMNAIVEGVKGQYANIAARSKGEAEHRNQKKMDAMVFEAGQREQEVRDVRRQISDTARFIQRLNGDLDALKRKEESLKKDVDDAIMEGDQSLEGARKDIGELEEALRRAKQDVAGQMREHQELMNLKLAMDMEMATYRKLLEGEEMRMDQVLRNSVQAASTQLD